MDAPVDLSALRRKPGVVRLHGHRGARGVMPENTLPGFEFALACGVEILELDVHFTRESIPVITHNPRLSADIVRDENGEWIEAPGPMVRELSLAELQAFDVGGMRDGTLYGARFPDQAFLSDVPTPRLTDLAAILARPEHGHVWLNLEIKSSPGHPEYTPPVPDMIRSLLEALDSHDLAPRTLVQCFDWRVLVELHRQFPIIARSFLSEYPEDGDHPEANVYEGSPWMAGLSLADHGGSMPDLVAAAGGEVWSPNFRDVTPHDLARARELELVVNVWTVNRQEDIDRMIALGVDGIITDYPGRVQRRLKAHGLEWA